MSNLNFARSHTVFLVCVMVAYYVFAPTTLVLSILLGVMATTVIAIIWMFYFDDKNSKFH